MPKATLPRFEDTYFEWLYLKFGVIRRPERSYLELSKVLHSIPFHWFVFNDGNREADGRQLQKDYALEEAPRRPFVVLDEIENNIASVLEVLVAFADRCAYASKEKHDLTFWMSEFFRNLGFLTFNDTNFHDSNRHMVVDRIDKWMARVYKPDGRGGLFPLNDPSEDQRTVELWYQMAAYIQENDL